MKPINNLIERLRSKKKEVDSDFVESLDAVLFFSEKDLDEEVKKELSNALIDKLSENLKRIYANQKEKKKTSVSLLGKSSTSNTTSNEKNIDSLLEQQKHIYDSLEKLSNYIKLDNNRSVKFGLNKFDDKNLNNYSIFYYLSFHSSIKNENMKKHMKILENSFVDKELKDDILNELFSLSYDKEKAKYVKPLIESFPINKIKTFKKVSNKNSRFLSDLFSYCAKYNVELDENVKDELFECIFNSQSYIARSNMDNDSFLSLITSYYSMDKIKEKLKKVAKVSYPMMKNRVDYASFKLSDNVKIYSLLSLRKLLEERVHLNKKKEILNKLDINDTINLIDLNADGNVKFVLMKNFINEIDSRLKPENLSYLLSLDSKYINIARPIYLKTRLEITFENEDIKKGKKIDKSIHKI